ncbi:hypothetical protein PFISCL1PPCAC_23708 [Pristionchus fissidentatus]|uniref:Signal peptidase complex subunit 3 n=1 Tax=Pristionchus fissidentatus TaxID=1538716 RepID=A0AAV5WKA4_9BILA|nr:hypothetical protein PFISCL1PPCAC_23708 [Pristionchus fissidentatus]
MPADSMHSLYARANAIFAFMLWVLSAVTAACFLSTLFLNYTTNVHLDVANVKLRRINDYASDSGVADMAYFDFSLKADVSPLFNWNVKQLFVYLVAEYATEKNPVNQVVIWDRILHRNNRVVIDERIVTPKYHLMDDGNHLQGHKNITFVLRYNVVPNAGYLRLAQAEGQIQVAMPDTYAVGKVRQ